ncbi:hypothetical protein F4703DRAFT_1820723 [Phycomyces blakesleeanus]
MFVMNTLDDKTLLTAGAIGLGIAASFVFSLYNNTFQKQKKDSLLRGGLREVPVPSEGYPYIGHAASLGSLPAITIKNWHEKLGPLICLHMGIQRWVFISDPNIAHQIFVRNGIKTSERQKHRFAQDIYGKGGRGIVFNQTSKKWKTTRSMALTILSPKYTEQFEGSIENVAKKTLRALIEITNTEGSVAPKEHIRRATYGTMFKAIFGESIDPFKNNIITQTLEMTDKGVTYIRPEADIGSFFPIFAWISTFMHPMKVVEEVTLWRDTYYKNLIDEAIAADCNSLVKHAYSLKEESGLDDTDILVMISDLMSAGGDTTSVSLHWLLAILSRYPDVQKKMGEEIDTFISKNNRTPLYSDRDELPYTVATLRENLRFRSPTTFGIPHYTSTDVEACGYFIPADTVLISSMHAMHMNPDVYDEPEKFKPERFLGDSRTWSASNNGSIEERDNYSFGWGRRVCPGIHFAEVEIFDTAVNILAACTIEPAIDSKGQPEYVNLDSGLEKGVVFAPEDYKVRFIQKTKNS